MKASVKICHLWIILPSMGSRELFPTPSLRNPVERVVGLCVVQLETLGRAHAGRV